MHSTYHTMLQFAHQKMPSKDHPQAPSNKDSNDLSGSVPALQQQTLQFSAQTTPEKSLGLVLKYNWERTLLMHQERMELQGQLYKAF